MEWPFSAHQRPNSSVRSKYSRSMLSLAEQNIPMFMIISVFFTFVQSYDEKSEKPNFFRNFAPRNQQKEGNYAETIDDDRADDLVYRYG